MTPPRPDDDDISAVNMAEVRATDALLSRLAAGRPAPGDRDDELAELLASLVAQVREGERGASSEPGLERLREVLEGRPMWVLPDDDLTEPGAGTDLLELDDPAWAPERRLIDLTQRRPEPEAGERPSEALSTAPEPAAAAAADPPAGPEQGREPAEPAADDQAVRTSPVPSTPAARGPRAARPLTGRPARAARPAASRPPGPRSPSRPRTIRPAVARNTETAEPPGSNAGRTAGTLPVRLVQGLRQLPVPVAAAIVAFTIGSGVGAAVGGGPMSPLSGVSHVVSGLSGGPTRPVDQDLALTSAQRKVDQAKVLAKSGQYPEAGSLLNQASSELAKAAGSEAATRMRQQIDKLTQQMAAAARQVSPTGAPVPGAGSATPTPSTSASVTAPPTSPSSSPSATTPATQSPSASPSSPPSESPSATASPASEPSQSAQSAP